MFGFLIFLFGVIATLGMCGLGAWSDFKGYRIPNLVSLIIILSFVVAYAVLHMTGQGEVIFFSLKSHLGSFFIVLIVTMAMFALKILGAGDSKMAASLSLWLGFSGLVPFLFYMTLFGGLIAVVSLLLQKYKPLKNPPQGWLSAAQQGSANIPYGIAIAAGGLIAFIFNGYFDFGKWAEIINL